MGVFPEFFGAARAFVPPFDDVSGGAESRSGARPSDVPRKTAVVAVEIIGGEAQPVSARMVNGSVE